MIGSSVGFKNTRNKGLEEKQGQNDIVLALFILKRTSQNDAILALFSLPTPFSSCFQPENPSKFCLSLNRAMEK